ncbi:dihydrolipoamide acetyltransferase family protein [Sporolactobacillus laevolacticus]|uniref:Dihydrolipoamide acetyltransferase component of pyruvate dehydrogenase complex n=1 Tax=Sporolactobacillus laevolacticus DSM 442 TaxID=1395513 RepID=V6IWG2_9BACL|nr:dihydrolipoamide acetyltransferase family protein [Sporolactobacillus laevolacticus]EST11643.1 branched-chain alpha-keto acid dehydrogenase subunit E2 [Sporolactobacillus laevolacticus DSM 442]
MSVEQMAMPQLGESVTEGTISQWLVSVGDEVKKYDPIAEVTTDKVNAEIPSSFSGKITALLVGEGDTLPVGEPICAIEVEGTEPAIEKLAKSTSAARNLTETEQQDTSMKKRYSPAVLRLAQEHSIDLETLEGTGRSGRITRKDVEQYIASGQATDKIQKKEETTSEQPGAACFSEAVAKAASKPTPAPRQYQNEAGDHVVALTGVRRAIATNMVRSKHEIPHAWTMIEVDVTNLVNYRNQIKGTFLKKEGHKLTYLPFFIKAIVAALKEFPRINSTWAGDKIIEKKAVNISLAVAADEALYVPVIKNADEKSIKGLAFAVDELASNVRENRLSPNDMQGGTFTVNNTGSFGSVQSQPIINYPQAAILSIESIVKRPVVVNDMIAIRDMVNLCISIDHRVLDGLITGRFLARVKELLENINPENTPIY